MRIIKLTALLSRGLRRYQDLVSWPGTGLLDAYLRLSFSSLWIFGPAALHILSYIVIHHLFWYVHQLFITYTGLIDDCRRNGTSYLAPAQSE